MCALVKKFLLELIHVADFGNSHDSEFSEMGIDNDRLRVVVADNADSYITLELWKFVFKLGAEISVFDAVDTAAEAIVFRVESGHAGSACSKMRVVVNSIK